MKIIWGDSSFDKEKEVKRAFELERRFDEKHGRQVKPTGVSEHLAHYPHKCEDCGVTYWDTDEYGGPHLGCRGQLKKAGFS